MGTTEHNLQKPNDRATDLNVGEVSSTAGVLEPHMNSVDGTDSVMEEEQAVLPMEQERDGNQHGSRNQSDDDDMTSAGIADKGKGSYVKICR